LIIKDRKLIEEQSSGVTKNAAKNREEKIARYRREKETKAKLEVIHLYFSLNLSWQLANL